MGLDINLKTVPLVVLLGFAGVACGGSDQEATAEAEQDQIQDPGEDLNALNLGIRPSEDEPNDLSGFTRESPSTTVEIFEPVITRPQNQELPEEETTSTTQRSTTSDVPAAPSVTSAPTVNTPRVVATASSLVVRTEPIATVRPATTQPPAPVRTATLEPESAATPATRQTTTSITTTTQQNNACSSYNYYSSACLNPSPRVVCGTYSYHPDCFN